MKRVIVLMKGGQVVSLNIFPGEDEGEVLPVPIDAEYEAGMGVVEYRLSFDGRVLGADEARDLGLGSSRWATPFEAVRAAQDVVATGRVNAVDLEGLGAEGQVIVITPLWASTVGAEGVRCLPPGSGPLTPVNRMGRRKLIPTLEEAHQAAKDLQRRRKKRGSQVHVVEYVHAEAREFGYRLYLSLANHWGQRGPMNDCEGGWAVKRVGYVLDYEYVKTSSSVVEGFAGARVARGGSA